MMCQITVDTGRSSFTFSAEQGSLLGETLRLHIPAFALPCAGNHTCGKCRVLVRGNAAPPEEAELQLLSAS